MPERDFLFPPWTEHSFLQGIPENNQTEQCAMIHTNKNIHHQAVHKIVYSRKQPEYPTIIDESSPLTESTLD